MTPIIARTYTELREPSPKPDSEPRSEPLDAFRSESAYVLLGDPGSGKTTAFEHECEELGAAAVFLDAREFLALDPGQHPEWRGKTLFIDGLDEVRAGSSDARTPFDRIRSRLDSLGRPPFRISCREADWLGENDRTRLGAVAPEATVTTLRLDVPIVDVQRFCQSNGAATLSVPRWPPEGAVAAFWRPGTPLART